MYLFRTPRPPVQVPPSDKEETGGKYPIGVELDVVERHGQTPERDQKLEELAEKGRVMGKFLPKNKGEVLNSTMGSPGELHFSAHFSSPENVESFMSHILPDDTGFAHGEQRLASADDFGRAAAELLGQEAGLRR